MRYLEEIEMRRIVLTMAVDASQVFCIEGKDPMQTQKATLAFARSRAIPVSVAVVPDGIKLTRVTNSEPNTSRVRRWDLAGLGNGERLTFTVAPAEHHKLRLAVAHKGKVTGWTIRCRLQDDGTMLVYRTDSEAPAAGTDAVE